MLSLEETLLLSAAKKEAENKEAAQLGTGLGAGGGALLGAATGAIPHSLSQLMRGKAKRTMGNALRPGFRMAGGLTGAILGGALGAGTAAVMRQDNPAAEILAKVQASGKLSTYDEQQLINILTDQYSNQSQMM